MSQGTVKHVTLLGLGLIGSSLGHALQAKGGYHITGYDVNADVRQQATQIGFCHQVTDRLADALKAADIVVFAVPVGAYKTLAADCQPHMPKTAVITDVGSVKKSVVADLKSVFHTNQLVPSHPIAGTEQSGPKAGFSKLFQDRWVILTPLADSKPEAIQTIKTLWADCGAKLETMTPDHHDLVLAITSHLPHLIAYTIVGTASDLEDHLKSEVIKFSASGFRDFTRIAASDPTMWRDIFLNNKEAVLEALARFSEDLTVLQRAIRRSEGDSLHALFRRTRDIRQSIVDAGQDTSQPDFGRFEGKEPPDKARS